MGQMQATGEEAHSWLCLMNLFSIVQAEILGMTVHYTLIAPNIRPERLSMGYTGELEYPEVSIVSSHRDL